MSAWLSMYLVVAKAAVLATGLLVLYYTARAAHHTGDDGLWFLSFGILLVGVGLLLAGVLSPLLGVDAQLDVALASTLSAAGLAVILYSMFTEYRVHATG